MELENMPAETETITVIKRNGEKTEFDENKIIQAILSAFIENGLIKEGFDNTEILDDIYELASSVTERLKDDEFRLISVDEIQEEVFDTLLKSEYNNIAKSYIQYAERKNVQRESLAKLNNKTTSTSNIKVSKKNGRIEEYNEKKLKDAIRLAAPNKVSKGLMSEIVSKINKKVETLYAEKTENSTEELIPITTEQLHDIVETVLTDLAPEIYEQYAVYRRYKKTMSKSYDAAKKDTERILFDGDKENANRDSQLNSTKQTLTAEAFMKRLVRDFELSPEIRKAHDEGWIYIHDIGPRYLRQINCFSRDTKFITENGVLSFNDFEDGDTIKVLTANGNWKNATVQYFGEQQLNRYYFKRGTSSVKEILATENHRWILKDGSETTDLKIGDKLLVEPKQKFDLESAEGDVLLAWIQGFIYGDGSITNWNNPTVKNPGSKVRFCGDKTKYMKYFDKAGFPTRFPKSFNGDGEISSNKLPKKEFIDSSASIEEIIAFVEGYLAADGAYSNGNLERKGRLQKTDENKEEFEKIRRLFPVAGYYITREDDLTGQATPFTDSRKPTLNFRFAIGNHVSYRVVDIDENVATQDVWCLIVEDDHSFVLDGGIPTGNCCLFDMGNVLKDGFMLNGVKYAEPKSFASAIALVGDVTLQASGQQYGGFTVPEIDTILAPYAERSYQKNLNVLKELDTDEQQLEKLALKMTLKEIEQGIQGYGMKLNTISSSLGQIPFNTITFGLNTSFWGREIAKAILKDRLNGIGEDKITAVFPKLVMLMRKEINRNEDAPNRDLYDLAIKCSQKRLYPDYLSLDGADIGNNLAEIYERSGKVVSPMGCVQGLESVYWNDGVTSIERMWNRLSKQFPIQTQPDGVNEYIDLENIKIADSHTGEKKMVECKRIIKNKATDWLEIKLKGGRILKCTPDHPLPVIGKGRMEAKDLKVGMELTASKPINVYEEKQIFGVEKAWLLGLILCDGCLNEPSEILVSYANTGEDEIRERIGQMFNQDQLRDIQQSRGAKGTYKEVAIKNRELRDLCVSLFNGMRKSERMLPKEIFNASREERVAFLAGMIDADGHIAKTRNTVQLGSVNPEIAYGQKELAESLGIRVNIYSNHYNSSDNTKIRWRVEFPATKELVDALSCEKKSSRFYELRNRSIDSHYYITSIEKVKGPKFSYDVTTESDYFDVSGIVSHNCRAYLSPYWNGDKEIYTGRGNTGAVTLNLPKIAIEAKGDLNKFYEMVDMYSELIWDFHESYINKISKQKASTSPLFYTEGGAWKKLKPDEEIGSVVKAFTSSLGYIGVEEAIRALTGGTLKNNQELGLEIVTHLKENADNATKNRGFLAALYSTPAESLCYTFQKMNKSQYGEIEGVTDREYITNSFHIPVWEQITVPEKIAFEEPFQKIATGGKISYTEFPYSTPVEVLQEAVDFAMDKGDYYGTNIVSSTCSNCHYEGDFRDKCPKCGNSDIITVSRVCGYLSFERMQGDSEGRYNPGKKAEILERVKHGLRKKENERGDE